MADVVGYSDFGRRADGQVEATAHYADGAEKRCTVRVSVEREIERDGQIIAAGEVASTDDGSVRVPELVG